jgi:hypothetical protein
MYRRKNGRNKPKRDLTEQENSRAEFARRLLEEWRILPGTQPDGSIVESLLRDWVEGVRLQAKVQKYDEVADYEIGELFAHAPAEPNGVWPCVPVRKIIEDWKSQDLEAGIRCERFNEYQPSSLRQPAAEKTWEEFAIKHRKHAETLAGRWPRTAALLRELAASYEGSARRHSRATTRDE